MIIRKTILLKFLAFIQLNGLDDPYNLTYGIRVQFEKKEFKNAVATKVHRHAKKGYENNESNIKPSSGINFLEVLNGEKIKSKQTISFLNLDERMVLKNDQ